jgi:hypothetical protein
MQVNTRVSRPFSIALLLKLNHHAPHRKNNPSTIGGIVLADAQGEPPMKTQHLVKMAAGTVLMLGLIALGGRLSTTPSVQAQDNDLNTEASRIELGFKIAPVPLKLEGKDRDLVGLGSYWVNAVSDCNFCHTAGGPPNYNFAAGFNPYFGQPKKTDPATYLAGGTDFGPALPLGFYVQGYGDYVGPDIISRNLTPDKTGMAEGGHTFEQFKQILRTGVDLDHLHPTCITPFPVPTPPNCIPPPVDGGLLQVMPWPNFQSMTDHDIRAIYEYLSAIPCIAGPPLPSPLHHDCGEDPVVGQDNASGAPHRPRRQ